VRSQALPPTRSAWSPPAAFVPDPFTTIERKRREKNIPGDPSPNRSHGERTFRSPATWTKVARDGSLILAPPAGPQTCDQLRRGRRSFPEEVEER